MSAKTSIRTRGEAAERSIILPRQVWGASCQARHHNGLTPTGCARVWSAGAVAEQGTVRGMHSLIGGGRDAVQRPEAARQTVSLWPDSGTLAANARQRRDSACALTKAVWSTGCWTTRGWMQPRGYCRVALQQAKACGAELTWHRRRRCLPKGPLAALVTDEGKKLAIPRYSSALCRSSLSGTDESEPKRV